MIFPSSDIPRAAVRSGTCWAMLTIVPCCLTFIFLLVTLMAVPHAIEEQRLSERGVEAFARIVGLTVKNERGGPRNHVAYDYVVLNHTYHKDEIIPAEHWSGLTPDTSLPILYDPAKPYESRENIEGTARRGERDFGPLRLLALLMVVFLLPSLIVILIGEYFYRREKALIERGRIASATISHEEIIKTRRPYSKLTYEFVVPDRG